MSAQRTLYPVLAFAAALLALFALWAAGAARASAAPAAQVPPEQVPQPLVNAIEQFIQARGEVSAGFCPGEVPEQVGQRCFEVRSLTETQAVVAIGDVAAQFDLTVTFVLVDGTWQVARVPDTGIGPVDGGSDLLPWLAVAGLVVGGVALTGSGLAARRTLR